MANSNTRRSMRSVGTPGATAWVSMSRHLATSCPALRMPAKASGPYSLICPVLRSGALVASTYVINSAPGRPRLLDSPGRRFSQRLTRRRHRQHRAEPEKHHATFEEGRKVRIDEARCTGGEQNGETELPERRDPPRG